MSTIPFIETYASIIRAAAMATTDPVIALWLLLALGETELSASQRLKEARWLQIEPNSCLRQTLLKTIPIAGYLITELANYDPVDHRHPMDPKAAQILCEKGFLSPFPSTLSKPLYIQTFQATRVLKEVAQ